MRRVKLATKHHNYEWLHDTAHSEDNRKEGVRGELPFALSNVFQLSKIATAGATIISELQDIPLEFLSEGVDRGEVGRNQKWCLVVGRRG